MPGDQQHPNPDVNEALKALSARLDRIETRLGIALPVEPRVERKIEPAKPTTIDTLYPLSIEPEAARPLNAAPLVPPPMPAVAPPTAPPVTKLEELARRKFAAQTAARVDAPATISPPVFSSVTHPVGTHGPRVVPPIARPRATAAQVSEKFKLERLVGGRLYAIMGALIVVVGLIMLLKLGMDKGWFTFPPAFRCFGVAGFGVLMMLAGEFVRRKFGKAGEWAGAGVAGAGLAAIYGAVLAAFGMYNLIGATPAFALLVVISAAGIAQSLHAKSLALAVLSLLGAYLNPLVLTLLGAKSESAVVMPSYLIALMVVGLVLAGWRPRPFRWLRGVAWWGTTLVGSLWIAQVGAQHPLVALPFLAIVWALVHAELFIGSRRMAEDQSVPMGPSKASIRTARPMLSSFATTIWSVGVGILVAKFTRSGVHVESWWISSAGLAGTSIMGLIFAGHLRAFRDVPETDVERLGVALWVQTGALLITTVALALGDWTQTVAWLAMGVGAISAGRWARAKGLEGYGLVVLVIALGRLMTWDLVRRGASSAQELGLVLDQWSLLMLIGGLAWSAAAWLLWRPSVEGGVASLRRRAVSHICAGIGLSIPFVGLLSPAAKDVSMAGVGIAWALAVLLAARLLNATILRYWGMAALMIVSVISGIVMLATGHDRAWLCPIGPLVLSDWSFVMLAVGAAWLAASYLVLAKDSAVADGASTAAIALGTLAMMFGFLATGTSIGAVCVVWVWMGILLVAAHQPASLRRRATDAMGLGVFVLSMLLWASEYLIEQEWLKATMPGLRHPGLWVALVIFAAMIGAAAWLRRGTPKRATWSTSIPIIQVVAGVILLGSTSLEVSRSAGIWFPASDTSQAAALTIWWAVFAVGMLIAGFAAIVPIIRHIGLGLLGLAAVKALVVDLVPVAPEWRVASFIGIGLLMLGVAVGYAKVSSKLEKQARNELDPPHPTDEHGAPPATSP
jgi:hypothetical protein